MDDTVGRGEVDSITRFVVIVEAYHQALEVRADVGLEEVFVAERRTRVNGEMVDIKVMLPIVGRGLCNLTIHSFRQIVETLVIAYHLNAIARKEHGFTVGDIDATIAADDGRNVHTVTVAQLEFAQRFPAPA